MSVSKNIVVGSFIISAIGVAMFWGREYKSSQRLNKSFQQLDREVRYYKMLSGVSEANIRIPPCDGFVIQCNYIINDNEYTVPFYQHGPIKEKLTCRIVTRLTYEKQEYGILMIQDDMNFSSLYHFSEFPSFPGLSEDQETWMLSGIDGEYVGFGGIRTGKIGTNITFNVEILEVDS